MSKPTLLVRVNAGPWVGMGHLSRVRHLLAALPSEWEVLAVGDGEALSQCFAHVRQTGTVAERLAAEIERVRPLAVLYDPPSYSAEECAVLERALVPVVLVDDFGGDYPADLVINGTVITAYHRYPKLRFGGEVLCGPEYALLAPAFAANPWRATGGRMLSVVVGGGENGVKWAHWLLESGALVAARFARVVLIVGAAFPDFPLLAEKARAVQVEVRQGLSSEALAQQLAVSDALLATGGMIAYEALTVGVPAALFPQVPNLVRETAWFGAQGAAIDLGPEGGFDLEGVGRALRRLASGRDGDSLSRCARQLVDGHGIARAAAAIRRKLH